MCKGTSPSTASLRSPSKDSVRPTFNLQKNLLYSQYRKSGKAQGRRVRHPLDPPLTMKKTGLAAVYWLTWITVLEELCDW